MKKVYLSDNNMVTLSCPRCEKTKEIDATPLLKKKGQIKLTYRFKCDECDCGHKSCKECKEVDCNNGSTNVIQIERRKYFRKEVDLIGSLFDSTRKRYPVRVIVLSRNGLMLKIKMPHSIELGQTMQVEFTLDDPKSTIVRKTIKVRKTDKFLIEGEFDNVGSYDFNNKKLGFYLMK